MNAAPGSASASASYRRARLRTIRWTLHYTDGLPWRIAEERLAEIASDLWEQAAAADAAGLSGGALARSVRRRRFAGRRDDLVWRRRVLIDGARRHMVSAMAPVSPVPLASAHLFDQANGLGGTDEAHTVDARSLAGDRGGLVGLLGSALASNAVTSGSFGGSN